MADLLDIITLDEFDLALNMLDDYSPEYAEKEQVITAASRMIDQVVGPVVVRTVTELHDGGKDRIWLRQPPVPTVTTVTEYDYTTATVLTAESNASKPDAGYLLRTVGTASYLARRTGGSATTFSSGDQNIEVVYQAGRYATTATVDARFKEAAVQAAIHLWQARGAGSGVTTGDGAPFAGVPFSTEQLVKKIRWMRPNDARMPALA